MCVALAQPQLDDGLVIAARKALPQDISTNEIVRALGTGLWNTNRTAIAIAIPKPKASVLFVFLRQPGGKYLAVDVSGMEGCNFGYLGTRREGYDRFETTPVEWLRRRAVFRSGCAPEHGRVSNDTLLQEVGLALSNPTAPLYGSDSMAEPITPAIAGRPLRVSPDASGPAWLRSASRRVLARFNDVIAATVADLSWRP